MASHLGVQSFATSRNAKVETFVEFVLEQYCKKLVSDGVITEYVLESQKRYISDIASDFGIIMFHFKIVELLKMWSCGVKRLSTRLCSATMVCGSTPRS